MVRLLLPWLDAPQNVLAAAVFCLRAPGLSLSLARSTV